MHTKIKRRKILFIFNMWVGRLEVMTVLVLFQPELLRTLLQSRPRLPRSLTTKITPHAARHTPEHPRDPDADIT